MNKYLFNLKYIVLGTFLLSLTACVNDDLPDVGDLEDFSSPTPFYNITDVTSSEFDCDDVELWAKYEFNFQAGSNLAVNGIYYDWTVTPSDGVTIVNKDLPILQQSIDGQLATVVALEKEIDKLEFKLPCESDQAKIDFLNNAIADLNIQLDAAKGDLSEETIQNVADLEAQILELEAATFQDRELIFSFPAPGDYTVGLTVTDNLGKSAYTEKLITVNQAVPTIPVPEITEASFEENSLFDGTGDGKTTWYVPSPRINWNPLGLDAFSGPQINTKSEGVLPHGVKAAKFPADGGRVLYKEIEVTPGATYVITYFSAFDVVAFGDMTVSILKPTTSGYAASKLEENILGTRTDNNIGRVKDVFKKHAITFEAGDNESVIIFASGSGDLTRLDAFDIIVKQ